MKQLLTAAALSSLTFPASAWDLTLSVTSHHYPADDAPDTLNESNIGIGFRSPKGWGGGWFKNSYHGDTFYLGGRLEFLDGYFGVDYGVASYGRYKWKDTATVLPLAQLTFDPTPYTRIGWLPAIDVGYSSIFTFQLIVPLDVSRR